MDEHSDHEDVDVFVSPKRFGGHTPAAKAIRQKVFEDNIKRAARESQAEKKNQFRMESAQSSLGFFGEDPSKAVHRKVGRNNRLSIATLIANYFASFLALPILCMGVWVALKQRDGGVAAYIAKAGHLVKSPLLLGLLLIFGAGCLFMFAFFFGVKHLAPSINEGLGPEQRKTFLSYQILALASMALLTIVLLSTVDPLRHVQTFGVTKTKWVEMSLVYPAKICRYEIENDCAGYKNMSCADPSARTNRACPGHFCSDTCGAGSREAPGLKLKGCDACYKAFQAPQPLQRCKANEGSGVSSMTCLTHLKSDLSTFFTLTIIASSTGLIVLFFVTVLGAVSSLISFEL